MKICTNSIFYEWCYLQYYFQLMFQVYLPKVVVDVGVSNILVEATFVVVSCDIVSSNVVVVVIIVVVDFAAMRVIYRKYMFNVVAEKISLVYK